jgi:hypothetical protein
VGAQVAAGEAAGQEPEGAQGGEQGLHLRAGDRHPGSAGAGRAGDGLGEGGQGGGGGLWLIRCAWSRRLLAVKLVSFSSGR